jgi:hypothetical protein
MKKLIFITGFLLLFGNAYSQITFKWYENQNNMLNIYGNPSDKSMAIDSVGNIYSVAYMTGDSNYSELKIIKYSSSGELLWIKSQIINIQYTIDNYFCFIKTLNNEKIVVTYNFLDSNNYNNIGILIYNLEGNLIVKSKYNNAGNENYNLAGVCMDKFCNIYVTGSASNSSRSYVNFITLKFNSYGNLVWGKRLNQYSWGNDIIADSLGNVYVCGASDSNYSLKSYTLTVKYDSSGTQKWKNVFGFYNSFLTGYDIATTITLDDSLNIIIGGSCFTDGYRFTIVKYKSEGNFCWYRLYTNLMGVNYITTDSRCNIYASGYTEEIPGKILKYDAGGNLKTTFSSTTEYLYLIKHFRGNYIYAAGNKIRGTINQRDFYFAIMDTNLNIINSHNFLADSSVVDYYSSMLFDKNGNVFLSGACNYDNLYPPQYKFSTVKLSQSTWIKNISNIIVDNFKLSQNYPNPFNPTTNIKFQISKNSLVTLKVFDILGKEIVTLVNEKLQSGEYEVQFPNDNLPRQANIQLPSGIYFYSLFTDEKLIDTKKMILLK